MVANSSRCTRDIAVVSAQKGWLHDSACLRKQEWGLEYGFRLALDQIWSLRVCLQQAAASGDVMNALRVKVRVKNPFFAPEPKGSPNLFLHLYPSSNVVRSR